MEVRMSLGLRACLGWVIGAMLIGGGWAAAALEDNLLGDPSRVSMEFESASLKNVLKTFSQQTGINVIASGSIAEQPITVYLEDVTVMDAFDQILRSGNLTYERPLGSEIYIVKPVPAQEQAVRTVTRIYRIKYARVSSSVLARAAAAFGARTPFEATLEAGGGGGAAGAFGGGGTSGGDVGIDTVIRELLTDQGDVAVDGRTNSLIITDVPENFPRLEAALAALDIRTPQILVDAEVIETTVSKLKDLGVEWGTGSEGTMFALTPAKRTTRMPFSTLFGKTAGGGPTSLTVGTFDTSQAVAALQMLESDTDTKILARPKILTLDNESAVIRLTRNEAIGFQTTSQTQTGSNTSTPERSVTGVVLVVTPQVNDNGYITMLIEPSVSKTVASNISPPTNQSTPRDPKTRSARSLVRIRSGDTLVVGGLIDRTAEETHRKVPILADIPFVGEAFKNKEVSDSASELIVFVTPRLLEEATAEQLAGAVQSPLGLREQEPAASRQESIEETLNELEQTKM